MGNIKPKTQQNVVADSLEAIQDYGKDTAKSVAKGVAKGALNEASQFADDFWASLLNIDSKKNHGQEHYVDPKTGAVEVYNAKAKKSEKSHNEIRAHIDYHGEIARSSERSSNKENHEMTQKMQEIVAELQRLISTSKVLEMEFATIMVEQAPKNVGEYHLNFFEWMLLVIQQAREKVEDSGAWLATVKGKNGKKESGYWGMFKKHGTSFGMSNERSVATSTG